MLLLKIFVSLHHKQLVMDLDKSTCYELAIYVLYILFRVAKVRFFCQQAKFFLSFLDDGCGSFLVCFHFLAGSLQDCLAFRAIRQKKGTVPFHVIFQWFIVRFHILLYIQVCLIGEQRIFFHCFVDTRTYFGDNLFIVVV